MTTGLASIVICAYNNWPDVELTIESALNQSYQPVQVIIVDNSSTDATAEEVPKRFCPAVQYVRQQNTGYAGACNTGFRLASGEFIQFVAGDDVLAPNKIDKQVAIFRANPDLDIVYGDVRMFQTLAGVANWTDVASKPEGDYLEAFIDTDRKWTGITALGVLFHRKALEKVGPWDEKMYVEDLDYWLRATWAGCRFGYCPGSPMGFVRLWPGQKTKNTSAMLRGMEEVWDKALGYITREPYRSLVAEKLAENRFRMAISRYQMNVPEALAKVALARTTSPKKVSAMAYGCGYAAIVLPGGTFLVRSPRLRPIRRFLASLFRYRKPQ
jgi:glycosyltransferase involved in cell wall biosynthesis